VEYRQGTLEKKERKARKGSTNGNRKAEGTGELTAVSEAPKLQKRETKMAKATHPL
jgi:hypothetical protein